jgi:hypothetical protein
VTEKTSSEAQEEVQRKDGEETAAEDSFDEDFVTLGILNLFGDEIKPDGSAHRAVARFWSKQTFMNRLSGPAKLL